MIANNFFSRSSDSPKFLKTLTKTFCSFVLFGVCIPDDCQQFLLQKFRLTKVSENIDQDFLLLCILFRQLIKSSNKFLNVQSLEACVHCFLLNTSPPNQMSISKIKGNSCQFLVQVGLCVSLQEKFVEFINKSLDGFHVERD